METTIQRFLERTFLVTFDEELTRDTDLFKAGVMDSFGYMQLLDFLGQEFSVHLTEDELAERVLVSLADISGFVASRHPGA